MPAQARDQRRTRPTCETCVFYQERPGLLRTKAFCASPVATVGGIAPDKISADTPACADYHHVPSRDFDSIVAFAANRGEDPAPQPAAAPRELASSSAARAAALTSDGEPSWLASVPANPTAEDIAALEVRAEAAEARAAAAAAHAAALEARAALAEAKARVAQQS